MKYSQLTPEDHSVISVLRRGDYSVSDIAQVLKRDRSTIYRELSRNATDTPKGLKSSAGLRQVKQRGIEQVEALFHLAMAASNLVRLPKLIAAGAVA